MWRLTGHVEKVRKRLGRFGLLGFRHSIGERMYELLASELQSHGDLYKHPVQIALVKLGPGLAMDLDSLLSISQLIMNWSHWAFQKVSKWGCSFMGLYYICFGSWIWVPGDSPSSWPHAAISPLQYFWKITFFLKKSISPVVSRKAMYAAVWCVKRSRSMFCWASIAHGGCFYKDHCWRGGRVIPSRGMGGRKKGHYCTTTHLLHWRRGVGNKTIKVMGAFSWGSSLAGTHAPKQGSNKDWRWKASMRKHHCYIWCT